MIKLLLECSSRNRTANRKNPKNKENQMNNLPLVPANERPHAECMKESTMRYMIDYLLSGLETLERCPAGSEFQEGYEQALRDTVVDLLRCHVLQERSSALEDGR